MVELHISEMSSKRWYNDKLQLHRLNGPAIVYIGGTKYWCQYNQYHRLDGPAVEYVDGDKVWYYRGRLVNCFSQEEFERYIRLLPFK